MGEIVHGSSNRKRRALIIIFCVRPNQRDYPPEERPAEEKVQDQNRLRVFLPPVFGNQVGDEVEAAKQGDEKATPQTFNKIHKNAAHRKCMVFQIRRN